jgi:hypothetical protein
VPFDRTVRVMVTDPMRFSRGAELPDTRQPRDRCRVSKANEMTDGAHPAEISGNRGESDGKLLEGNQL